MLQLLDMNEEKALQWLNELADEVPKSYNEYFYDDVRNYVVNIEPNSVKIKELFQCSSKSEVKSWLDDVSSYIVSNLDVEQILTDYLD